MALIEAFKILISSIMIGSKCVTENETACSSMTGRNFSLAFSDNCLLSFKIEFSKWTGKITAAAVTGPARQPRPASSVPTSKRNDEKLRESIFVVSKKIKLVYFILQSNYNELLN